jgi:hypothetical protein
MPITDNEKNRNGKRRHPIVVVVAMDERFDLLFDSVIV